MSLQITKDLLKPWSPCSGGYKWFVAKFPQGAEFTAVQKALRDDKRFDNARWLTEAVWRNLILETPILTLDVVADHKAEALEIIAETTALTLEVPTAEELGAGTPTSTSDGGKADSQIGASGDSTQIGASGDSTQIGASGHYTQIGASGDSTQIGASGHSTQINATGKDAVIACAGPNSRARAGANGVMALPWFDKAAERTRIAVGYVGEDLKPDTWYEIKEGKFVEVLA
jgi:hypothetical protein